MGLFGKKKQNGSEFESHREVRELLQSLMNNDSFCEWAVDDGNIDKINTYLRRNDIPDDVLYKIVNCIYEGEDFDEFYLIRLDIVHLFHNKNEQFVDFFVDKLVSEFNISGDVSFPWERFSVNILDGIINIFLSGPNEILAAL